MRLYIPCWLFFLSSWQRSWRNGAQLLLRTLAVGLFVLGGLALYAWIQNHMVWHEDGLHGGVGSFSTYIVTSLPALLWSSLEDTSPLWRRFAKCLIFFALFLAFITLQRAVWPVIVVELLIALLLFRRSGRLKISGKNILLLASTLFILGVLALSFSNQMRGITDLSDLVPSEKTFGTPIENQDGKDGDARLPFWPAVLEKIAEHPVTGAGFGRAMMKKAYPELVPDNFTALWHAHNVVLNYALQMGIPGALALLFLFCSLGRYYWKSLRDSPINESAAIAGIMLLVAVLLRNQTNDFFRRDLALLFWSLTGVFCALVLPRSSAHA